MFNLYGDPRGRGNYSVPYFLFLSWKLALLGLTIDNKKVHDAEFSEEIFDSALVNLTNHQADFRKWQNLKINRVIVQEEI